MRLITRLIMLIVKVIVTLAVAIYNLAVMAFHAAFAKAEEVKSNAPSYKEQLREEFKTLDVSEKTSRFTGVFDSWTTKMQDYIESRKPQPKPEILALPAPRKDAA